VAGFKSEWWPGSNRNGGRLQIGIPGRIASEFASLLAFGRSPAEFFAGFGTPAGAVGLASQVGYGLFPFVRAGTAQ
jgi:hypothetical protein